MSKWRPVSQSCLYVIPDIHGAYDLLDKILRRILPLRKTNGIQDKIVFLGDYIDRHQDSHKVVDKMVELKKDYGDNVICLVGNHELMILEALNIIDVSYSRSQSSYDMWMYNGGYQTIMGYMERAGLGHAADPLSLNRDRIKSFIPKQHIEFFTKSLVPYYEENDIIFVHGGCDPFKDPSEYSVETLAWDRALCKFVENAIIKGDDLPWERSIVTGHNSKGRGITIIKDHFMMLDCGSPKKLLVAEMQSMTAYMSYPNKNRLVKYKLEETKSFGGVFCRVGQ